MTVAVALEGVSAVYDTPNGPLVAVRDLTAAIATGQRLGLVGPSGSGKTTLLHVLGGLQPPATGTLTWFGALRSLAGAPGRVTVAFQAPSLLGALSVTENVALPLVIAGTSHADAMARAAGALEALELDDLASQLPEELSGGQAQRVGLARALVSEPDLLLCDEPTGQLDQVSAARILDVILDGAPPGRTVVVSTHDAAVIDRLDSRWDVHDGLVTVPAVVA